MIVLNVTFAHGIPTVNGDKIKVNFSHHHSWCGSYDTV